MHSYFKLKSQEKVIHSGVLVPQPETRINRSCNVDRHINTCEKRYLKLRIYYFLDGKNT